MSFSYECLEAVYSVAALNSLPAFFFGKLAALNKIKPSSKIAAALLLGFS
jgi:hypothetical protein